MSIDSLSRPAISINRSPSDGGMDALRRMLARVGVRIQIDRYAVVLAFVSLLTLVPMMQAGYFWGAHDARHSVYFLFEFDRVFRDGVVYPRWFPDMTYGFGYPLFNIYGPLAFYIGEIFHLIGFDFVTTVKIVFALAWVLSGLAMYGFVKRVFENRGAAFVAGLLYVFMPYHLIDVYVRAALAESVALVFMPLTLWAFYETMTMRTTRSGLFAAFAYAAMVFAHNGIALLFSLVLGAWIIFLVLRTRKPDLRFLSLPNILDLLRTSIPTIGGLALGLGLTGIFMIPLVLEYKYINVGQWTQNYYNYQDHFVDFNQLFSPVWGFGISNLGPVDGLSFQIGIVPIVLFFVALFVIAKNPNNKRTYTLFFFLLSVLILLLMFDFSLPAWRAFGLASVAQFPWRLLTLTMVSFSIVGGSVMLLEREPRIASRQSPVSTAKPPIDLPTKPSQLSNVPLSVIAISALIVIGSYPYITSQNILQPREGPIGLAGLMAFENSANEMTGITVFAAEQPRWSPLADNYMAGKNVKSKVDFSTVPASVFIRIPQNSLRVDGERIDYNAPDGDATIVFNVQMYPGWNVYLTPSRSDEIVQKLDIQIEPPYGRIKITIPQGEHGLMLRFEDTAPRTAGTILTGISFLIALGLVGIQVVRRRKT